MAPGQQRLCVLPSPSGCWAGPALNFTACISGCGACGRVFVVHQAKLTSRPFLVQGPSYVEFWYGTSGHPGTLTLEFLMRGRWWRLWSRTGPHGDQWHEAKLSVPEQARQFRFRTSEWPLSTAAANAFYLASITLSKTPASRRYLTLALAVGGNHNCAMLSSTGQLKMLGPFFVLGPWSFNI